MPHPASLRLRIIAPLLFIFPLLSFAADTPASQPARPTTAPRTLIAVEIRIAIISRPLFDDLSKTYPNLLPPSDAHQFTAVPTLLTPDESTQLFKKIRADHASQINITHMTFANHSGGELSSQFDPPPIPEDDAATPATQPADRTTYRVNVPVSVHLSDTPNAIDLFTRPNIYPYDKARRKTAATMPLPKDPEARLAFLHDRLFTAKATIPEGSAVLLGSLHPEPYEGPSPDRHVLLFFRPTVLPPADSP
jgi:hypothetical protein